MELDDTTPAAAGARASRERRAFAPGDVAAGRYRIARFVAEGGMGEVYEAEDQELGGRVALKTLRPDIADAPGAVERFRREVNLARRVTHRNVCRLFDLGRHEAAGSDAVHFLTMEFLDGETLAARVRRGPLGETEARPLVAQIADALDALHAEGIIHRDLKCTNVLLVPSKDGPPRAVVTDFGLARGSGAGEHTVDRGDAVGFSGTPAYMAPEQLLDLALGVPTDVYALGVVLFELVTGALPVDASNIARLVEARLHQPPPSPRARRPELDERWERAILRCLARKPEERFAHAGDVVRALDADLPSTKASRSRALPLLLVGGALALGGVGLALHAARRPATIAQVASPSTSGPRARPHVAAIALLSEGSGRADDAWVGAAVRSILDGALVADDGIRACDATEVDAAFADLALVREQPVDAASLARLGKRLDADVILDGSFTTGGDGDGAPLHLTLRARDAGTGAAIGSPIAVDGRLGALPEVALGAAAQLRQALGLRPLSSESAKATRAILPANLVATREMMRARLLGSGPAAESAARRAIAADPDSALAHYTLGLVADDQSTTVREFDAALAHARPLSLEERLSIEHEVRGVHHQQEQALGVLRALADLHPDDVATGVELARLEVTLGRIADARATVARLRALPRPLGDRPEIDLADVNIAFAEDDRGRQLRLAIAAHDKAAARGARTLAAEALEREATCYLVLGDGPHMVAVATEAERLRAELKQMPALADALVLVARAHHLVGDHTAERRAAEERLGIARSLGNQGTLVMALLGLMLCDALPPAEVSALRDEIADLLPHLQPDELPGDVVAIAAARLLRLDDFDNAGRFARAAIRSRGGNDSDLVLDAEDTLARAERALGRLPQAKRAYEAALVHAGETDLRTPLAPAWANYASFLAESDDLPAARRAFAHAITLERQQPSSGATASYQLAIAEETAGNYDAAVAAARTALDESRARKQGDGDEAPRVALLVETLAESGRLADARARLDEATRVFHGNQATRLSLSRAYVDALSSRPPRADAVAAFARALDADGTPPRSSWRLAQYRLEAGAQVAGAEARLTALAAAARNAGELLMARRAREALHRR